jgi:hypothetical protein
VSSQIKLEQQVLHSPTTRHRQLVCRCGSVENQSGKFATLLPKLPGKSRSGRRFSFIIQVKNVLGGYGSSFSLLVNLSLSLSLSLSPSAGLLCSICRVLVVKATAAASSRALRRREILVCRDGGFSECLGRTRGTEKTKRRRTVASPKSPAVHWMDRCEPRGGVILYYTRLRVGNISAATLGDVKRRRAMPRRGGRWSRDRMPIRSFYNL